MSQPILPDLVRRLKTVSEPSMSPDGSHLAYTLSWIDREMWESRSRVMNMDLSTEQTVEFNAGDKNSAPRFSPDGYTLAFLSTDDNDHKQLWVVDIAGGKAKKLTSTPEGVIDFSWSPDSKRLVFCADANPDVLTLDIPDENSDGAELPQVKEMHRIRSVSYTHLTLPTILLV